MFAMPIKAIAKAPNADVVSIPMDAKIPPEAIALHISIMKAGKCAVMKPS